MAKSKAKLRQFSYVSVRWVHTFEDEPISMVSELDSNRMERRKIEYFLSSKVGVAGPNLSRNGTILGSVPVPTLDEISRDQQFVVEEIDAAEFESQ